MGNNNHVLFGVAEKTIESNKSIGDGKWHQVVATHNSAIGEMALYIDGTSQGKQTGSTLNLVNNPAIKLGTIYDDKFYRGSLDYLQIYDTAFSLDAVQMLYKNELKADLGYTPNPSSCVVSVATAAGFDWTEITARKVLPRGSGPVVNSAGLTLNVDATPPTATLDSLLGDGLTPGQLIDGYYLKAPSSGTETLIIGGNAEDKQPDPPNPTDPREEGSGVKAVWVQFDGKTYPANGKEAWTFAMPVSEGAHAVKVLVEDNVGNIGSSVYQNFLADGTPPVLSLSQAGYTYLPSRAYSGNWSLPLNGEASDGDAGFSSGLDPQTVEVRMQSPNGSYGDWQPALWIDGGYWKIGYELPSTWADPSGVYTVTVKAADIVGNETEKSATLELASVQMDAFIDQADAEIDPIIEPVSLNGMISSSTGIANVAATFTYIDPIIVISDTVLHLPLDEGGRTTWFADTTLPSNSGRCSDPSSCPIAGQTGMIDGAAYFNGDQMLEVFSDSELDAIGSGSFTIQAWIKPEADYGLILTKLGSDASIEFRLDEEGQIALELVDKQNNTTTARGFDSLVTGDWTHVAAVVNPDRDELTLFVNGEGIYYGSFNGDASNDGDVGVGTFYTGLLDDIMLINRALTESEVLASYQSALRPRPPVTFTATGEGSANWQVAVPSGKDNGLEGFHQLDLLVTDNYGNTKRLGNLWRGIIDTLPPRVTFSGDATTNFYLDDASGDPVYDIVYSLEAEDLHLDIEGFQVLCNDRSQAARDYLDEPWVEELFPDMTMRNRLSSACHDWTPQSNPQQQGQACDIYGNCTLVSTTVDTSAVQQLSAQQAGTAKPMIVWPLQDSVVAITDTITIKMAAASSGALQEMAVMNMVTDEVFDAVTFDQSQDVKRTVQTLSFPAPAEKKMATTSASAPPPGMARSLPAMASMSCWMRKLPPVG